ncbi:IclR family transcriptional regulator [Paralcaligenes sp. KSB-10]|uniref:IclR family transcriptional regulator n=1 Tax=Paralcaligenes sp. KSB-10 TaxID=2901142 RepID=UPI001E5564BF|nr:IclR family transcriptional regulator [Paralcaligenes sp. KSB-10]UHL65945.1 IclR family transcriptional regulator [Paralcaligenes sp. KSB-10]
MDTANTSIIDENKIDGNTPTMRLFALLEVIAQKDQFFSLQSLVEELGLPKPTLHRMLQQLEGAGMIQRDGDGRQYSTGLRLRRMAENLLLNNTVHGARHSVLRQLVEEVGESCNITTCSGSEVLYLDRVETIAPLRFYLHPGSRVPVHCSASGKLFLAQMTQLQRRRLLAHVPLTKYTDKTLITYDHLDSEIERVRRDGYAVDDEEFFPGLLCVAVLVPVASGKSNMAVAIQAPIMRMTAEKSLQSLPALQRAARSLAAIEAANGENV